MQEGLRKWKKIVDYFKEHTFGITTIILGNIPPGILTIYFYNPQLFIELNTVKLILLAVSISMVPWLAFAVTELIVLNADN